MSEARAEEARYRALAALHDVNLRGPWWSGWWYRDIEESTQDVIPVTRAESLLRHLSSAGWVPGDPGQPRLRASDALFVTAAALRKGKIIRDPLAAEATASAALRHLTEAGIVLVPRHPDFVVGNPTIDAEPFDPGVYASELVAAVPNPRQPEGEQSPKQSPHDPLYGPNDWREQD